MAPMLPFPFLRAFRPLICDYRQVARPPQTNACHLRSDLAIASHLIEFRLARRNAPPTTMLANPTIRIQNTTIGDDGAAPPVSGRSDVSAVSGTAVGNGAGDPAVPTANFAGTELRLPHTLVPEDEIRTMLDRIVSESSALITTRAKSEMFERSASGSGTHTSTASLNPYDETLLLDVSTAEISVPVAAEAVTLVGLAFVRSRTAVGDPQTDDLAVRHDARTRLQR